ncbi:hypothetical protein [Staphylococcus equorum]|uniref:Uncharacterized protein n=1 Tax=Staphylococcus equorum TaxID=246432 RepID=A0AAP7LUZ8_9STAP|nr:hypothetical protein [Staphylococcus equorum]OEK58967.1 hypothetical protein ASS94_01175 [Staphylococcus equorum]
MDSNAYLLKKDTEIIYSYDDIHELKEDFRLDLIKECNDINGLNDNCLKSDYLKSDYLDENKTLEQIKKLCKYRKEYIKNEGDNSFYTLSIYKYIDLY